MRPAEVFRECLFIGVDQKWPADSQNGAIDPLPTSMTELTVDGRNSRLGPGLIRPTAPYRTRSGARLHCSRENGLTHFDALQVLRAAFSARTKSLTSRGWQILSGSSCSVWSCSAAGIVEPLHHRPTAVGKCANDSEVSVSKMTRARAIERITISLWLTGTKRSSPSAVPRLTSRFWFTSAEVRYRPQPNNSSAAAKSAVDRSLVQARLHRRL